MNFSRWLGRRLVVQDKEGGLHPPGSGRGAVFAEPNGGRLAVFARGDGFDLVVGQEKLHQFAVTPSTMVKLAVWVLWWHISANWLGLKTRLWAWVQTRLQAKRSRARA